MYCSNGIQVSLYALKISSPKLAHPAGAWPHKGAAMTPYRSTISRTFVSQRSREFGPPKQPTSIVVHANSHTSRGRVYLLAWLVEFQLIQLSSWHWSIKVVKQLTTKLTDSGQGNDQH